MRGAPLLLAALLLLSGPIQSPGSTASQDSVFKTITDAGLTVRYRGATDRFAARVLERANTFLEDDALFLGLSSGSRYTIIIADSREDFARLQPTMRQAPEWAGALTYPSLGLVLIMTPGAMNTGGDRYWSLLQHEMAHLILGDAEIRHQTRLPRWFQEGIATYVSGEMNLARLLQLGYAQVTGAAPEFAELEFSFPDRSALAGAAYARSYLFIRYLTRRFGNDAVALLIRESLENGGIRRGVASAFGISFAELMEGFDQYARVKATWVPAITSTATVWAVITMLFLVTYFRKRLQGLRTVRQWDEEEEALWGESPPADENDDGDPTLH